MQWSCLVYVKLFNLHFTSPSPSGHLALFSNVWKWTCSSDVLLCLCRISDRNDWAVATSCCGRYSDSKVQLQDRWKIARDRLVQGKLLFSSYELILYCFIIFSFVLWFDILFQQNLLTFCLLNCMTLMLLICFLLNGCISDLVLVLPLENKSVSVDSLFVWPMADRGVFRNHF